MLLRLVCGASEGVGIPPRADMKPHQTHLGALRTMSSPRRVEQVFVIRRGGLAVERRCLRKGNAPGIELRML